MNWSCPHFHWYVWYPNNIIWGLELQFLLFGQRIHPLWLGVGSNLVSGRKGSLLTNMLVIKPLTKLQMVPEKMAPREQIWCATIGLQSMEYGVFHENFATFHVFTCF